MPHREHGFWDLITQAYEWASPYLSKLFKLFIAGGIQVFVINRNRKEGDPEMTKKQLFGIWASAIFIGWLCGEIALALSHPDWAGIAAAVGALFSLSIYNEVKNALPAIGKWLSKRK